jgi:tetratricopeptide (TPR) repeat protein
MRESTTKSEPMQATPVASAAAGRRFPAWLPAVLLALVTILAYQPVWHAGFIWDDNDYVTRNLTLRSVGGLAQIWCHLTATPQYYPLVHTSFWLEYHLWGLNPLGYHVVNVLLHALAAVLLWRVLVRLQLSGAWLAAGIFALHPVAVESVAWVTERKNVLAGVFYLAAALAYLRWTEGGMDGKKQIRGSLRWYYLAFALFVAALLSKTVACSLPAAMLLVMWWKRGRIAGRDVWPLLPFFVAGVAMGLVTSWLERTHVGAQGPGWAFSISERCLIAGRALWFYADKLFWPANLTFIYPRWQLNASLWWQWIFPVASLAVVVVLWCLRPRIGRGPLVAVLYFAGTLFPALGFTNVFPMRYTFVADHYQYLACAGLIIPFAALVSNWIVSERPGRILYRCLSGSLLLLLGFLTWKRSHIYADRETLWRDTLAKNPTCWLAHNNLGNVLLQKGRVGEAIIQIKMALAIKPDLAEGHYNFGDALVQNGQMDEAMAHYQKAIEIKPDYAEAHSDLGYALFQNGQTNEALVHYQTAVGIKPDYAVAQRGLAFLLSNAGFFSEAIYHYEIAALIEPQNGWTHHGLGLTLLKTGRVGDAIPPLLKAVEDDPQNALYKDDLGHALSSSGHGTETASNFLATARSDPVGFGHFLEAMQFDTNHVILVNNLAWSFAANPDSELRNGKYAVRLATRACEMTGFKTTVFIGTLAAAYAEAGRFDEAVATGQKACALASELGEADLLKRNQELVALYLAHQPYHEPPSNSDASQLH